MPRARSVDFKTWHLPHTARGGQAALADLFNDEKLKKMKKQAGDRKKFKCQASQALSIYAIITVFLLRVIPGGACWTSRFRHLPP